MTETVPAIDAATVPRGRYLAAFIPGPHSRALHAEFIAEGSNAFCITLPVFVARADRDTPGDFDEWTVLFSIRAGMDSTRPPFASGHEGMAGELFLATKAPGRPCRPSPSPTLPSNASQDPDFQGDYP